VGSIGILYIDNIASGILFIINVQLDDVVVFPAVSIIVTVHIYVPFPLFIYIVVGSIHVVVSHDEYISIHVLVNTLNVYHDIPILSDPDRENVVPEYIVVQLVGVSNVTDGAVLSIRVTVAVVDQVVHCLSIYCHVKLPLPVNVYNSLHELFTII
jgi:hypothetical protein